MSYYEYLNEEQKEMADRISERIRSRKKRNDELREYADKFCQNVIYPDIVAVLADFVEKAVAPSIIDKDEKRMEQVRLTGWETSMYSTAIDITITELSDSFILKINEENYLEKDDKVLKIPKERTYRAEHYFLCYKVLEYLLSFVLGACNIHTEFKKSDEPDCKEIYCKCTFGAC